MGFLRRLFNATPSEEMHGIGLDYSAPLWEVHSPQSLPDFLRALVDFVPEDAILYTEGGDPDADLSAFLKERSVPEQCHVGRGTFWPRPRVTHLPATRDNLTALAHMMEDRCDPELAWHIHVYHRGKMLLQWFDVGDNSIFVSKDAPEEQLRAFCSRLATDYQTSDGVPSCSSPAPDVRSSSIDGPVTLSSDDVVPPDTPPSTKVSLRPKRPHVFPIVAFILRFCGICTALYAWAGHFFLLGTWPGTFKLWLCTAIGVIALLDMLLRRASSPDASAPPGSRAIITFWQTVFVVCALFAFAAFLTWVSVGPSP